MAHEQGYAVMDSLRHDLYRGAIDTARIDSAMGPAGVSLQAVSDPGNPDHYRARVVAEYGAQALRALDSLAHEGAWVAFPALDRLPAMCPEPEGTTWREATDPTNAWWQTALGSHAALRGGSAEQQATHLCALVGLCAALLDWWRDQGVEPT